MIQRTLQDREQARLGLQENLDGNRSRGERNRLGQFATPTQLASEVVNTGLAMLGDTVKQLSFMDPGFGTGSFFSALSQQTRASRVKRALGFEIDPHYCGPAVELWSDTKLVLRNADFLMESPSRHGGPVDLIVCNPPYVRHHHIESTRKAELVARVRKELGLKASGLAGLYVYFLLLSHEWLNPGGVSVWLIPGEFMDVNYGRVLKEYLGTRVRLDRIHRFRPEDVQFTDALVSSVVVWFRKAPVSPSHTVELTDGGTLTKPEASRRVPIAHLGSRERWSTFFFAERARRSSTLKLGDLFKIQRGIATGANEFFILPELVAAELPREVLKPLLPPPRYLKTNEILAEPNGDPSISPRSFLLDVRLPIDKVRERYGVVADYLESGASRFAARYLCRSRRQWYEQEVRAPAPLLCTYMGRSGKRGTPFRFIMNHSTAIATNVYLMLYPRARLVEACKKNPQLMRQLWQRLDVLAAELFSSLSRVYGGGLHKFEPTELGELPVDSLSDLIDTRDWGTMNQPDLFQAVQK